MRLCCRLSTHPGLHRGSSPFSDEMRLAMCLRCNGPGTRRDGVCCLYPHSCPSAPGKCPPSRRTKCLVHAAGKGQLKHRVPNASGWYPGCRTRHLLYSQPCTSNNFPFPVCLMKMGSYGPCFSLVLNKCCILSQTQGIH